MLVPVAALLLSGCGGSPAAAPTGTLVVDHEGTPPPLTAWYVRVETMDAEPVTEHAYPNGPIALTEQLSAGKYRVISWNRPCTETCPKSGEQGLGPLSEVCGAPVTITNETRTAATVVLHADGTCTIRVGA
jgi:hypothetical protein